jgi:hypothetical protein
LTCTDDGQKYEHLRALEGAKERLQLVRADILDYKSLVTVIRGCHGVFHMATVMNNHPVINSSPYNYSITSINSKTINFVRAYQFGWRLRWL